MNEKRTIIWNVVRAFLSNKKSLVVVLPKALRDERKLQKGDRFLVTTTQGKPNRIILQKISGGEQR